MDTKIFLQAFNSKKSVNTSEGVNMSLKGKRKLLPTSDVGEVVNAFDVYTEERRNCNKIRLTCQVNTVCTNVLFNDITEIVENEGSSGLSFLNYGIISGNTADASTVITNNTVYFKDKTLKTWYTASGDTLEAIRDTQLTNCGYIYHCGKDILNNHLIRSNTFKMITQITGDTNNNSNNSIVSGFNTINDTLRDVYGEQIKERVYYPLSSGQVAKGNYRVDLHVYKYDDLLTYKKCIEERLIKTFEGWVGFYNKSKMKSYNKYGEKNEEVMNIDKPIAYLNGGDFVDMYPDRSLYSFVPKYNKFKNRVEKNWNYCLTYPSSSYMPLLTDKQTDRQFDDIIEPMNDSLKALYFNENTVADNGTRQIVIYSIAKHGLSVGDHVNIYSKDIESSMLSLLIGNARVTAVADDYIFTILSSVQISKYWVELTDEEYYDPDGVTISINVDPSNPNNKTEFKFYERRYFKNATVTSDTNKYYVIDGTRYVNFDRSAQRISYKKVVNGIECNYYVRIFSKIPNFKNASADTSNEYQLYKDNSALIHEYQKKEYDFESHVSRLAFAKNIYSDDIGEIVFTDDIDISNLKDNLGRPLTSIYLTIVKNNKGYKEWYGYDTNTIKVQDNWKWSPKEILYDNIEYSHCFGRVTCGIETCVESRFENGINAINQISPISVNSMSSPLGYNVDAINDDRDNYDVSPQDKHYDINMEEVWFDLDRHYYGDLCCYDNYNAVEQSLQPIMHRFNTAQRECSGSSSSQYFSKFKYDDIRHDDYDYYHGQSDGSPFVIETKDWNDCNNKKEGYYYNPHYEIKIKSFGKINTAMPDFLTMTKLDVLDNEHATFTVLENHYLSVGDKVTLYDTGDEFYYTCVTTSNPQSDNYKRFTCVIYKENGDIANPNNVFDVDEGKPNKSLSDFKMFKMDNLDIPSYAKVLRDGTCRVIWRDVLNNGFNMDDDTIEEYPFTNGAFYINKGVNLYLKRQDPYNIWELYSTSDIFGAEINLDDEDNYVKENEIVC